MTTITLIDQAELSLAAYASLAEMEKTIERKRELSLTPFAPQEITP